MTVFPLYIKIIWFGGLDISEKIRSFRQKEKKIAHTPHPHPLKNE